LLLLATMINYMDRLTLNQRSVEIMADLGFDKIGYGRIESAFALAFAAGAILVGFLVDRWNVWWIYPLTVLAWSAAGVSSGFAQGFTSLLVSRFLLGLAESGNWPCALRTTQRILPPSERAMGNSILQSGAALGAILLPLIMLVLFEVLPRVTPPLLGQAYQVSWRTPFILVGAAGALWVFLWWAWVRPADLALPPAGAPDRPDLDRPLDQPPALSPLLFARRFAALVVLVISINMTWHYLRAWLPLYLREQHGYSRAATDWFAIVYYLFTDVGALTAGFITLKLAGRLSVHSSRRLVFLGCALLTALCLLVDLLPTGFVLLGVLLVIGFGALGVFPNYYSFSQDLTVRHQGKLTGILGCCCWIGMACWQLLIGWMVKHTGSYTVCFVISGLAPLVGFLALLLLWGPTQARGGDEPVAGGRAPRTVINEEALLDGPGNGAIQVAEQRVLPG
jgi:ACS family hexuronate transporter-like MFS transporter